MAVSRIDLADAGSPERLVIEILKSESDLPIPVPINELCEKLDIIEIQPLTTKGYEGGLLTQIEKTSGIILFNKSSPRKRQRFTIAHELGHFLMPSHVPSPDGSFLCSQNDMLSLAKNEVDRRRRMEAEANRFASHILLPAPQFRKDVSFGNDPDIAHIIRLSDKYDVSREALGRAYVGYREEPTAFILVHEGQVLRYYKDEQRFPFISVDYGAPIPRASLYFRRKHEVGVPSEIDQTDAGVWIDARRGERSPDLYEQVYLQRNGYALIMLTLELDGDERDPDEDRTAKERHRDRQARFFGQ